MTRGAPTEGADSGSRGATAIAGAGRGRDGRRYGARIGRRSRRRNGCTLGGGLGSEERVVRQYADHAQGTDGDGRRETS